MLQPWLFSFHLSLFIFVSLHCLHEGKESHRHMSVCSWNIVGFFCTFIDLHNFHVLNWERFPTLHHGPSTTFHGESRVFSHTTICSLNSSLQRWWSWMSGGVCCGGNASRCTPIQKQVCCIYTGKENYSLPLAVPLGLVTSSPVVCALCDLSSTLRTRPIVCAQIGAAADRGALGRDRAGSISRRHAGSR